MKKKIHEEWDHVKTLGKVKRKEMVHKMSKIHMNVVRTEDQKQEILEYFVTFFVGGKKIIFKDSIKARILPNVPCVHSDMII